jgi:hypothetical protein
MRKAIAVLVFTLSASASTSTDKIVSANFPAALTEYAAEYKVKAIPQQAYVSISVDHRPGVVAAYSNGYIGAVLLIDLDTGAALNAAADSFAGTTPEAELHDFDADGVPDVLVRFDIGKGGTQTWIYRVVNKSLVRISPIDDHGDTSLMFPEIVDFGRHGAMDLIEAYSQGKGDDTAMFYDHYVLQDGAYVKAPPLDFYHVFYREKGEPKESVCEFAIPAAQIGKPFHLVVMNGGPLGSNYRVAAGAITMNGSVVSPPSDFSVSRGTWSLPIVLQVNNRMTVRLEGKPTSRISVAVTHD